MNKIFDGCVRLLYWLADLIGATYEQVNVVLFVFMLPSFIFFLILKIVLLTRRIRQLKAINNECVKLICV